MSSKKDMLGSLVRVMVIVPGNRLGLIQDIANKLAISGEKSEEWEENLKQLLYKDKKPN
ncbi:MAG: hypothetical protein NUV47_03895 [Patescibacteria group bacterium]|nr:hypothetical protein [Patescibacteria group bacterium]